MFCSTKGQCTSPNFLAVVIVCSLALASLPLAVSNASHEDLTAAVSVEQRAKNAVVGALVGDAASMGLHWIYDDAKLSNLVRRKGLLSFPSARRPEFFEPPSSPAYTYSSGSQTPYGDEVLPLLQNLAAHDNFDKDTYTEESHKAAKEYSGRLNKVMTEFIDTKSASSKNMQAHGMVKAPFVAARYAGSQTNNTVAEVTRKAAQVHQQLTEPVEVAVVAARMLELVILGKSVKDAFEETLEDNTLCTWGRAVLRDALDYEGKDPVAHFGKSSTLPGSFQGAAALLKSATSYEQVMRENILAGGDSASRAVWIGAVMGAVGGVPKTWKAKTSRIGEIEKLADQVVEKRNRDSVSAEKVSAEAHMQ
mmetsp:Transcript_23244/g.55309  ORF Transcript_23244/g.55309 Transcript_23244/m.55309 type:complete len:364 (-) Transcript_23244:93-1184(-)